MEIKIKETVVQNDVHIGVNGTRGHFVIRLVEVESRQDSELVSGKSQLIKFKYLIYFSEPGKPTSGCEGDSVETADCNANECGSFECCQYITLSRLVFR